VMAASEDPAWAAPERCAERVSNVPEESLTQASGHPLCRL
jgi:hypothetical protein